MNNLFPNLPETAKLWIYQSNRKLSDQEVAEIALMVSEFVSEWVSHTNKVIADGKVLFNRFIVLAADETQFQVSGCSIDSSVGLVRAIDEKYQLDLFNRFNIAYKSNGEILSTDREDFQTLIDQGKVNEETIVFNNMVSTIEEFEARWEVPFKSSWHAKVFALSVK